VGIRLDLEDRHGWLLARLSGAAPVSESVALVPEIVSECLRLKVGRVIVDFSHVRAPVSTTERFELGKAATPFARHGIRIAALARPDQLDPERFGARVATNRGVTVRAFTDIESARAWLLNEEGT
jgi:hypothetical protein